MAKKQQTKTRRSSNIDRHLPRIDTAVGLLVALTVLVATIHTVVAYDVWWQVAAGSWIAEHGWPSTDPFSYGFPDRPWIELRWMWCLGLSFMESWFGPNGIIGLRIALVSIAFALLWLASSKAPLWARNLAVAIAVLAAHLRLTDRPEIASFVFLAATLLLVDRYRQSGKTGWIAALPVLQVIWVNTHTVFAIGPVTVGIYAVAELVAGFAPWPALRALAMPRARAVPLAAVASAMVLACLVNPWGINGPLFALKLFGQIQSGNVVADIITEMQSPLATPGLTVSFIRLPVAVAVSLVVFALSYRRLQPGILAVWAAFLYLAVASDRNLALFGFVAGVAVAAHIAGWESPVLSPARRRCAWAARVACAALALVATPSFATNAYYVRIDPARRFGFGVAEGRFPIRAMAFVDRQAFPGRILCNLADGNLILRERGRQSVYVDGRLEVYPAEALRSVDALFRSGTGFAEVVARHDVRVVVLAHATDGAVFRIMNRSSAWVPVYFDEAHSVFVRVDESSRPAVEPMRVNWAAPVSFDEPVPARYAARDPLKGLWPKVDDDAASRNLGILGILVGNLEFARTQLEEAYRRRPDPSTALQLGVVCRALGADERASFLLARAGPDGGKLGTALAAGGAFEAAGNFESAVVAYEGLVTRGEAGPEALTRLARVRLALGQRSEAIDAANRALAIDPENGAARQILKDAGFIVVE